jgi:hypothetical protein
MIHPEIENFWTSQGMIIEQADSDIPNSNIEWYVVPTAAVQKGFATWIRHIATGFSDGHIEYLWEKECLNEETMLRIVRMKMFL